MYFTIIVSYGVFDQEKGVGLTESEKDAIY